MSASVGNLLRDLRPPRWPWLGAVIMAANCLLDGALLWLCSLLLDRVLVPFAIGAVEPLLVAYTALVTARGLLSFVEIDHWTERATPLAFAGTIAAPALRGLVFLAMLGLLQGQLALVTLLIVAGVWWGEQRARSPRARAAIPPAPFSADARAVAGVALVALLGLLLLALRRLSPGGLLVTLAAATQLALLLARAEWPFRQQRHNATVSRTRPDWSWPMQRLAGHPARRGESFLLVGVPLLVLLAALLGSLARAGDIRPTLPFPGLMLSRPVTPTVAIRSRASGQAGGAASPGGADTPIWLATVGPLPTGTPLAPTATTTPTPGIRATTPAPTAPSTTLAATASPTIAPSATVPPTSTRAAPQTASPLTAPPPAATQPPAAPPPPPAATATPVPPPTERPGAVPTLPPTPTPRPPTPTPEPSPEASPSPRPVASAQPTAGTGSIPTPPDDDPDPVSPTPTTRPTATPKPSPTAPAPSPTPSPAPTADDDTDDEEEEDPQPTPQPSASPSPTATPSPKVSPTPRPSPSPSPTPQPSPDDDDDEEEDNDTQAPTPSPTPKPSAKSGGSAAPSPTPTPRPTRQVR